MRSGNQNLGILSVVGNSMLAARGDQQAKQRLAAFRSDFQAAHGGMNVKQALAARSTTGGASSVTGV